MRTSNIAVPKESYYINTVISRTVIESNIMLLSQIDSSLFAAC